MSRTHGTALGVGTAVERYVVERVLGSGAQATVYLVRHAHLGTRHALKVVTNARPAVAQRLLREGHAQGTLKHSGVVPVTDLVSMGDKLGLVMEYVEGPTLQQLLASQRPTLAQLDALAPQLLSAVGAAHDAGIIHRDLKPGNILLQIEGDRLRARIADFGLAKLLEPPRGAPRTTRSGVSVGTPHYMAPEQVRNATAVDGRADVFSLGAILYEMVTGRLAFPGDDEFGVFERIVALDYAPLQEVRPELPLRMQRAIESCLQPLEARASSCRELAAAWRAEDAQAAWSAADLVGVSDLGSQQPASESLFADVPAPEPEPEQVVAEARRSRRGPVALAVLAVLAIAASAVWVGPQRGGRSAQVSGDPELQHLFELGYAELLDADVATAVDLLGAVVEAEPDAAWARFLHATARGSSAELQEIAASVDGSDANEELIALVAAVYAGERDPAQWDAFFERNPDHFLGRLRAAGLAIGVPPTDYEQTVALHRRAVQAAPQHALGHWILARHMVGRNRLDEAGVVLDAALADHPGSAGLLLEKSRHAWALGDLQGSRTAALSLLHHNPGSTDGRAQLAVVHLALSDLAAYERQVSVLLAEEVPPARAAAAARHQAAVVFGFGLQRRARALTQECARIAREAGLYDELVGCWTSVLQIDRTTRRWDELEADIAELKLAIAEPEVSPRTVVRSQFHALHGSAFAAAGRGALDEAEELLERLYDVPQDDPIRDRHTQIAYLEAAISELRGATHPEYLELCAQHGDRLAGAFYRGTHFLRAGDPRARAALEEVLEHAEGRVGSSFTRQHEAEARVLLAELLVDSEPELAIHHADELQRLWPLADADHELVLRADAARALASRGELPAHAAGTNR